MTSIVDHQTEQYGWNTPVFRRGFPITFNSACDDCYNIKSVSVVLRTGRIQRGNLYREYRINAGYVVSGWRVQYESVNPRNVAIILNSPPTAIIGQYTASIFINGRLCTTRKFLLFFNPWCQDDAVYLENTAERFEYIKNTHTIIYMGTYSHIQPRGWYLAQFQPYSIEAALSTLDRMPAEDRSSPIKVSRFLSALMNANDDNGVIMGKWSGDYAGGVNPNAWNGSGAILAKYSKYRSPVRWGQCWVYSGVLCTMLRTCGIPARCITTYNSFHDHDGSLAWEMYLNRFMRPVHFRRQETMWNFHCWNEAWMERKDLPSGYGGWQIVDSTPQERSQGFYRCGPASQRAIKEGNVDFPFDSGFVFAEVNADKIFYYQSPRGGFVVGRIDSTIVGRSISCKAVGSNKRADITSSYKYPDNSPTERIIQTKINMRRRRYRSVPLSSIRIQIIPPTSISFTSDCFIYFTLTNSAKTSCRTKFRVTITSVNYKGTVSQTLLEQMYETTIAGQSEKQFREVLQGRMLKQVLWKGVSMVKVDINGLVNDREFVHGESSFEIDKPRITIDCVPSIMQAGENYRLRISVRNPFERPLTNTKLYLSGDVLLNGRHKIAVGTVVSMGHFEKEISISSRMKGEFYIYASLTSNEIAGFEQSLGLNFN